MEKIGLLILWVIALFIQYRIFLAIKKNTAIYTYVGVSVLLAFVFGSSVVAYFLYRFKFARVRKQTFDNIIRNTDSNSPDTLIKYINSYGIINEPESWNMVRGVWFSINESSKVPTTKKRELRDFLTTKGLRLVGNDKNVIDNYKG